MSRGSKPGERRGGRRKGTPNKPKVDALAAELLARAPHPPAATANALVVTRAKDTMAEFATLFAGDENGFPVWRDKEHRENFYALAHKAMLYSNWRRRTRTRLIERSPSYRRPATPTRGCQATSWISRTPRRRRTNTDALAAGARQLESILPDAPRLLDSANAVTSSSFGATRLPAAVPAAYSGVLRPQAGPVGERDSGFAAERLASRRRGRPASGHPQPAAG
jgi:hypothetical protein